MPGKILVIDDEEKYATMLKDLLEGHDFDAEMCTDPREGLKRLNQKHYDLIITDYKMPELDGAELLHKAREIYPDIPVIVVSGLMNMPELIKVANMGVTLVLEKPFETEDFLGQVERFVARRNSESAVKSDSIPVDTPFVEEPAESPSESSDFQIPQPTKYFSAESPLSQSFLEALYRERADVIHQFVSVPCYSELESLGFEISQWTYGDDRAPCLMHFEELILNGTQKFFGNYKEEPGLWLIVLGSHWNRETFDPAFRRWMDTLQKGNKNLSQCRFLYQVPNTVVKDFEPWLTDAELESAGKQVHRLARLPERPEDITGYLHRYTERNLESGKNPGWKKTAAMALLCCDLKRNLQSLQGVLGRIFADPELGDTVTRPIVERALSWHPGHETESEASEALYLRKRQAEFIQQNRGDAENWQDTAKRLGAVASRIADDNFLHDQPILVNGLSES